MHTRAFSAKAEIPSTISTQAGDYCSFNVTGCYTVDQGELFAEGLTA
ncbi:hypothetical protein [Novosphingobium sp.]|nr:hypothetical protein [Novosphingobium sp.]